METFSMSRPTAARSRAFLVCCGALILVACGGGGGGGGGGGQSPSTPATTGLVPAATAAGTVLVEDSSVLRPLLAGASWTYRQFTARVEPLHVMVRHAEAGAGAIAERRIDPPVLAVDLRRAANGDTIGSTAIALRPGLDYRLEGPELTRELRASQLIVVHDRRVADIGTDLDGDTRPDGADIAGWRKVVGWEDLELPGLYAPVRALRLDDVAVARFIGSSGGPGPATYSYGSTWLLPGVGIVRSVVWEGVTQQTAQSDLRLMGFDGISRGLGITTKQFQDWPGCCGIAALPDGFLTLGLENLYWADFTGSRFEPSPFRRPGEPMASARHLLITANGTRLVRGLQGLPDGKLQLDALDARGRLTGERLALIDVADTRIEREVFVAHRRARQIWMVGVALIPNLVTGSRERELVVSSFTDLGAPQGSPRRFPLAFDPFETPPLQIEALADGLVILLNGGPTSGPGQPFRVIELAADGAVRIDRTYLLDARWDVRVVAQGNDRWLLWSSPRLTLPGLDGPQAAQGMRLGADGVPVGVVEQTGLPFESLLPMPERYWSGWPWNVVAQPAGWTIIGTGSGSPAPEILEWGAYSWLGRLQPPAGDLRSHAEPRAIWVPGPMTGEWRDGLPQPYMVLDDRTFYFGGGWGNWRGGFTLQWH
jgi:hypothetical protein